jgi:hypothetical protein
MITLLAGQILGGPADVALRLARLAGSAPDSDEDSGRVVMIAGVVIATFRK